MIKLVRQTITTLVIISVLLSCKQTPTIEFDPFHKISDLTYEDLIETGFHPIEKEKYALVRLKGNDQLLFEFEEDNCVPNIMNDGVTCSSFKLTHKVFSHYFQTYDSLQVVSFIEKYGGSIAGNWRTDWMDINHHYSARVNQHWYFPVLFNEKRFIGEVFIATNKEVELSVRENYTTDHTTMECRTSSVAYELRHLARELLKSN